MTYPPQQPGPYGQQNPWDQPQPGQFPPQQQPPSQAPPWLSGDPGGYGGFPGFEPEQKKSRGGVIAAVIIVAILVLGGGGFGVWMLVNKDDSSPSGGGGGGGEDKGGEARAAAEKYVEEMQTTVNSKLADIDLSALETVTCADDFERMDREIGDVQDSGEEAADNPPEIKVGMADFESTEEKGSFTLTQSVNGKDGPDREMTLGKEDDAWKVCGLYESDEGGDAPEPSQEESTDSEPSGDAPTSGGKVPNPIPTS
ncbi:Rv0361 family membrane protein [Actinophytocola sediminis]